jgi:DNA-binding transcriptional ArsR family regulator
MKQQVPVKARAPRATGGETPSAAFADAARCQRVVGTLSLLANSHRLRILCALADGELSVNEIVCAVKGKISGVSQQLKLLTLAGYLERRRSDRSVIYRLTDQRVRRVLHFLKEEFPAS